jgi:hypothetical protein
MVSAGAKRTVALRASPEAMVVAAKSLEKTLPDTPEKLMPRTAIGPVPVFRRVIAAEAHLPTMTSPKARLPLRASVPGTAVPAGVGEAGGAVEVLDPSQAVSANGAAITRTTIRQRSVMAPSCRAESACAKLF